MIQTNAANNIAGSLTTIAQEGSFGVIDNSDRSMLYLYPSFSFAVSRWGSHDFKAGAELYPFLRNKTSRDITPLEFYYRPPGTTGAADVLFERDTFRTNGGGTDVSQRGVRDTSTAATSRIAGSRGSNISIKAGFRVDSNRIYTKDREKVLGPALPAGFPTVTADKEFSQTTFAPNFGVAWDIGTLGRHSRHRRPLLRVARPRRRRRHVASALRRRHRRGALVSPRTVAPMLNQALPGAFPLGVNYGFENKKTYTNEFSAGWEKQLPNSSSVGRDVHAQAHLGFPGRRRREHHPRSGRPGAFLGRPFPDFDAVLRTYAPNYSYPAVPLGSVALHQELRQPVGHQRELLVRHSTSRSCRRSIRPATRCSSSASPRTS